MLVEELLERRQQEDAYKEVCVCLSSKMWKVRGRCWPLLPVQRIGVFCGGVKDVTLVFFPV